MRSAWTSGCGSGSWRIQDPGAAEAEIDGFASFNPQVDGDRHVSTGYGQCFTFGGRAVETDGLTQVMPFEGHNGWMVHDSVHVSTSIDRPADEVYAFVTDPSNLSKWAAGLAESPLRQIDGEWVANSPLGRVSVAFVGANHLGVADHVVTLPSGERVTNPMRVFANGDGCDVVFSVRRLTAMSEAGFEEDVDAVARDLAVLRSVMET